MDIQDPTPSKRGKYLDLESYGGEDVFSTDLKRKNGYYGEKYHGKKPSPPEQWWTSEPSILFKDKKHVMKFMPSLHMAPSDYFNSSTRYLIYATILVYLLSDDAGNTPKWVYYLLGGVLVACVVRDGFQSYISSIGPGGSSEKYSYRSNKRQSEKDKTNAKFKSDSKNNSEWSFSKDKKIGIKKRVTFVDGIVTNDPEAGERSTDEASRTKMPTYDNPFMNLMPNDFEDTLNGKEGAAEERLSEAAGRWEEVKDYVDEQYYATLYRNVDDLYDQETLKRSFYTLPNSSAPNDQIAFAKWCYRPASVCKESAEGCLRYTDPRNVNRIERTEMLI
jgi:hypothetical protein